MAAKTLSIVEAELVFIINPAARNAGSLKVWQAVEKELLLRNRPYQVFYTAYQGHAAVIAKQVLEKTNTRVILAVVGGDGTMHEVINGAAGFPHAAVISIPAGSGNDYARGIQGTAQYKKAMAILMDLHPDSSRSIDLGEYDSNGNKGMFVNSIGMGIDAEITAEVNRSSAKKWFNLLKLGKLVYIYFFVKKLITYQRTDMKVIIDGQEINLKKVWFIVVSNQPYFGGGINISPRSVPDDGKFNVIAVHDISRAKLLSVFITVFWGGHLRIRNVDSYLCNEVVIDSSKPVFVQADGEVVGQQHVAVRLAPTKIRILYSVRDF
ncbi:diacylglycerol/lipid kinase family protein [Peribacillus sp. SCS-155]|uniref:diacylglycerol/lipid kinase family protein n=1 Tax=Peribacillus sedimenti TaxID=3115297 RepID=UPI0039065276